MAAASSLFRRFGLPAGCLVFALLQWVGFGIPEGDLRTVVAIAAWMLIWWISEAVPIAVTALLPLILFPLTGTQSVDTVAGAYGSKFVFLFMGGFIIALAMEKWMLHKRLALMIVAAIGSDSRRIILGFMIATAALSMWISNTATTLMMLPIAMSIIALLPKSGNETHNQRFTVNLLLGIAYAANCGGIATLVGTPPNVAMAGIMSDTFGTDIGFGTWMLIGLPFSILLLFAVFFLLTSVLNPLSRNQSATAIEQIQEERAALGKITREERRVLVVFASTAMLWVTKDAINAIQPWIALNDSSISMLGGLSLFIIQDLHGKPLLQWNDTTKMPWGILLLFGGGMALANALRDVGLIDLIAGYFADSTATGILTITAALIVVSILLTELISNLALVLVFVPIVAGIAQGMGLHPLAFAVPVTLAASCAFMLPIATPPNAIVFAGGKIRIATMMRNGVVLNLVAATLAILMCQFALRYWIELF